MNPSDNAEQIAHYEHKLAFEMDSWDLKVALEDGVNVTVIDARTPEAFSKGRIPGAQNLPHRDMTESSTNRLDRSSLIVTYCDGIGCNASTKAALKMARLGFDVRELIGGLDWWIRDGHATELSDRDLNRGEKSDSGSCGCG